MILGLHTVCQLEQILLSIIRKVGSRVIVKRMTDGPGVLCAAFWGWFVLACALNIWYGAASVGIFRLHQRGVGFNLCFLQLEGAALCLADVFEKLCALHAVSAD